MKKETFYKVAIVVLLVVNILQLIPFLLGPKKGPNPQGDFRQKAIKMMNLNKTQEQQFLNFAQSHHDKIKALNKKQLELTSTYFTTPTDSLLNIIAKVETQKINTTEHHFSEIKSILKSNQIDGFNKFKEQAIKSILKNTPQKSNKPPSPN